MLMTHFSFPRLKQIGVKITTRHSLLAFGIAGLAYLVSHKRLHRAVIKTTSLMCKIERKEDAIKLVWPNEAQFYRVFRGVQTIYSGPEPYVAEEGLTAGTIYTYTIESMDEARHVLNRMKIQTSTTAENKKEDNILLDLVFTTIVAKGQISLEWEPIKGIERYIIYRNGMKVGLVNGCSFSDRSISENQEYTYTIKARRPLPRSEQETYAVKSFLASIVGAFKKGSSQEQAAIEEITNTKRIGHVQQLLQSIDESLVDRMNQRNWQLRYTTFLPEEWLKNPNLASKVPYFKGDGRGFDPESSRYRTRVDMMIRETEKDAEIDFSKAVGKSEAYDKAGVFLEEGVASDEDIVVKHILSNKEKTTIQLTHSVGNPIILSPAVDYKVIGTFYRNGEINIAGYHDQAPHHEVYLKEADDTEWQPLHQAKSKGLEMMARPTANHLWRFSTFTQ
ncbi:hypothetical protein ABE28_018555 [Peribacillus muralis]|uniref:DUF3238 domain-containing protein n=1 Tax=Peribacillus muralis TaxID=264697 RepID=A0A1B3XT38_9BACI|nr:DUF3238 domain-containing protein [Peribacillus muralis]AOH56372.1 hypothetical protein ABE28_018555 [Peribacillus muralis]